MCTIIHSLSEFNANAIGLNGNFSGPCIICLDQQAITVVNEQNEVEIAKCKWPYSCIRQFNLHEPDKFSFVSGNRGPFGIREYTFEIYDVRKFERALQQFIGMQVIRSRSQAQQSLCAQGKNYSMESRAASVDNTFISPGHAKLHASPTPGPRLPLRDYLASENNDVLHLTAGYKHSLLRNSVSTGNLLESSCSSSSPQQVPHKTHVCLFVPFSGENPCVIEDEHQYRSLTSTQFTASNEVPALPPRE